MDNWFLRGRRDLDVEIRLGQALPNAVMFAVHQRISKSNKKDLMCLLPWKTFEIATRIKKKKNIRTTMAIML